MGFIRIRDGVRIWLQYILVEDMCLQGLHLGIDRCRLNPSYYDPCAVVAQDLPLFQSRTIMYLMGEFAESKRTVAMSRAKSLEITAKICKRTGNIKVCLQVLLSRPQALFRYDLMAMAENAIQLSRKESNDTVNFFNNLASSKDTNPALKLVLKSCISNFKEGFMFLNLSGLEGRTATFDMHNAYDQATACETDLSANKVAFDLVAARIKKWKDVFSVAMATAGVLEDSLPIPE